MLNRHVLAVPVAFTTDHVETLYEIDQEYTEEAHEQGMHVRSSFLNVNKNILMIFIEFSTSSCIER